MRLITCLITAAGLCAAALIGPVGAAQAASCPAEQYIFSDSKSNPPFQCGVHHWSSKKSIAAWDTKSWSSDTALGYKFKTKCRYKSDGDLTYVWGDSGPSYWITFTNWEGGTRHFGSGVIFATGSVDSEEYSGSNSCDSSAGKIKNSLKKITKAKTPTISGSLTAGGEITLTGTIEPTDAPGNVALMDGDAPIISGDKSVGAALSNGSYTIKWKTPAIAETKTYSLKVAYGGNTKDCKKAASWCGWGPAESNVTKVTVTGTDPSMTTLSARSAGNPLLASSVASVASTGSGRPFDPGLKQVNVSATMPRKLGANCPSGYVPLSAELWGGNTSRLLSFGRRGVSLKKGAIASGRKAGIQLNCRKSGKGVSNGRRIGLGTPKGDRMSTKRAGALLLGGPGADFLTVSRKNGVLNGGLGADRLVLKKPGIALGGAGADSLVSKTAGRTLLVGGPGRDSFRARGNARIDARDGEVDVIVCVGGQVKVKADSKDVLRGVCQRS